MKLTALSGISADELDGEGLNFGNANNTFLTIADTTPGTQGRVIVQGAVALAQKTTTTMNFSGTNNTADSLEVQDGPLWLGGTLKLLGGPKPTQPLYFFDDLATPLGWIFGNFSAITDNINGTDTGVVVTQNQFWETYKVTIQ